MPENGMLVLSTLYFHDGPPRHTRSHLPRQILELVQVPSFFSTLWKYVYDETDRDFAKTFSPLLTIQNALSESVSIKSRSDVSDRDLIDTSDRCVNFSPLARPSKRISPFA
jgi:hypothetical protein